jgi:hypothetical protein
MNITPEQARERILNGTRRIRVTPENIDEIAPADTNGAAPAQDSRHAINLRHISDIVAEQREPRWLIRHVLEQQVLAVLAGPRGTFKSFIALHWSMLTAISGQPVVMLCGEGAGLDRRVDAWSRKHAPDMDLAALPFYALEMPLNLNNSTVLADVSQAIRDTAPGAALIVIDTYSKFSSGLDENDNSEVAQFLSALATELRDAFNATVLLVAHSGHSDAKRPRGASALMANPDAEYIVERPAATAMTVTVTRERFKDSAAREPLAYVAEVVDLGRVDSYGDPVTSLAISDSELAVAGTRVHAQGKNQTKALNALREWLRANPGAAHINSGDLSALLRAQAIGRQRRPEVLNFLVCARILTPAVGGYAIDRNMA